MRKGTHARVARAIAEVAGSFTFEEIYYLERGSVVPDEWKNYPHRYGKGDDIRKHIYDARQSFLDGKRSDALWSLGVALHYIAGKWIGIPSSDPDHSRLENMIHKAPLSRECIELLIRSLKGYDETIQYAVGGPFDHFIHIPVALDESQRIISGEIQSLASDKYVADIIGRTYVIGDDEKVYGIIRVEKPRKESHKMSASDVERAEIESLWCYPITVIKAFSKPFEKALLILNSVIGIGSSIAKSVFGRKDPLPNL